MKKQVNRVIFFLICIGFFSFVLQSCSNSDDTESYTAKPLSEREILFLSAVSQLPEIPTKK